MGRDHWDAILASTPLNRTAGVVTGSSASNFTSEVPLPSNFWPDVPAMRKVPLNGVDLTGLKVGRLTVVGLLDRSAKGNGALWVCRCACGAYTGRKAKGLQAGAIEHHPPSYMCEQCFRTHVIRYRGSAEAARNRAIYRSKTSVS